jgi:hypothetical protein
MMLPRRDGSIRWMTVLLVSLLYFSPVRASLGRKQRPAVDKHIPIKTVASLPAASANDEFRITPATEVLLDGRPCRYEQVPDSAIIILLETVTNENKEIARIHFRTSLRKAPSTMSKQR